MLDRSRPWILCIGWALALLPAPATALTQTGQSLSIAVNAGATLGEGDLALSLDADGTAYRPPIRILVPDTALERFSVRYTLGAQTVTLINVAPPGSAQATFSLNDTSSSSLLSTAASTTAGPLRILQSSSFGPDGRSLQLTVELRNLGSVPLTGVRYLRAANPDPDLDHQGLATTVDDLVSAETGNLATATGPASSLTLALGVIDAPALVGFCYRCVDPATVPYDSGGRQEDWDLVAVVSPGDIAPGGSVRFTLLYLAAPTLEAALADWDAVPDRDGDGVSGLEGDCDDTRPYVYPGALELCDGRDGDCDGTIDEDTGCYDDDGDGYTEVAGDCDDADPARHPGAAEGGDVDQDGQLEGDGIDQDCDGQIDEGTDAFDDDCDGTTERGGDCDDADPALHPGAIEVPYDGIDQDCDGADLIDVDDDGHDAATEGGDDCDDADAAVYPGALEALDDRDDDCDGLIDEAFIAPGSVLITEVMYDPDAVPDRDGEWIELYNAAGFDIDLRGWTLSNAAGQRQVLAPDRGSTRLPAGTYRVLGADPDAGTNGGVAIDYPYADLTLANAGDRIALAVGELVVETVAYGPPAFPDPTGASIQRSPECMAAEDGLDGSCWCASRSAWTEGGDLGSPGLANPVCPPPPGTDEDGDGHAALEAGGDDCDDADPARYPGAAEVAYDGIDQDCNGADLEDGDGDGVADESRGGDDCDDADPTVHPGAPEDGGSGDGLSDGLDNDCDGAIDEGLRDTDDDGDGYTELEGDCDDGAAAVHPGAVEVRNGVDDDCDGRIDPGWTDEDRDGFTPAAGDCDDRDDQVHPGMPERPDGIDQDCDGRIDEETVAYDDDGDGLSETGGDCDDAWPDIHPGAGDRCGDGIDQDCDGVPDQGCEAPEPPGCGACSMGTEGGAPPSRGARSEAGARSGSGAPPASGGLSASDASARPGRGPSGGADVVLLAGLALSIRRRERA